MAITVSATAYSNYQFVRWSNGVSYNPYTFAVTTDIATADATYIAYFVPTQGIGAVQVNDIKVYTYEGRIIIEGVEDENIRVFDVAGRMLTHSSVSPQGAASSPNLGEQLGWRVTFEVPGSGTYIVEIGDHPARKIVVIR